MEKIGLSINEVLAVSGLGRTSIYKALGSGALPARKVGKKTLILQSDLVSFLKSLETYPVKGK